MKQYFIYRNNETARYFLPLMKGEGGVVKGMLYRLIPGSVLWQFQQMEYEGEWQEKGFREVLPMRKVPDKNKLIKALFERFKP